MGRRRSRCAILYDMEMSDVYAACRNELIDLAESISVTQAGASLAATPPWTVLDGYRHLAGVCADFLDGRLDGAGSPEWTAAQIQSRQSQSLAEVCAEWTASGPLFEAAVAQMGPTIAFLTFDVWTHGHDIRAAIGAPGNRRDPRVRVLADAALSMFAGRYEASGAPTLLILVDGEQYLLGPIGSEATVTLGTSAYELLRILFGRRSAAQIAAANWTGDAASAIDALHIFDLPVLDIVD